MGIPKEEHDKLFDTFYRAKNVGNVQGSGIGLSIVKEFVNLHKGQIEVESKIGVGTTFNLSFPKN